MPPRLPPQLTSRRTQCAALQVDLWVAEQSKYDANNPVFDPNTGHFTQASTQWADGWARRAAAGWRSVGHLSVAGPWHIT